MERTSFEWRGASQWWVQMPFSPVHNARKFSAVLGTISANNSKTIRPTERKIKLCQYAKQLNKHMIEEMVLR